MDLIANRSVLFTQCEAVSKTIKAQVKANTIVNLRTGQFVRVLTGLCLTNYSVFDIINIFFVDFS